MSVDRKISRDVLCLFSSINLLQFVLHDTEIKTHEEDIYLNM